MYSNSLDVLVFLLQFLRDEISILSIMKFAFHILCVSFQVNFEYTLLVVDFVVDLATTPSSPLISVNFVIFPSVAIHLISLQGSNGGAQISTFVVEVFRLGGSNEGLIHLSQTGYFVHVFRL